jgi:Fe-S oxidoreductase
LRERILSNVDSLGKLGCVMPGLTNRLLDSKPMRVAMDKILGISRRRSLPMYTRERFDEWFSKRLGSAGAAPALRGRGNVTLWDDTFVRYHEPGVGIAAVKVLEALGFEVSLANNRRCCGRPAFSQGNLDTAAELAKYNVDLLASPGHSNTPIIFLEPSCWSMFVEDYRELKIPGAENVAARCFLFEKWVGDLLAREPHAIRFTEWTANVVIHPHCHAKSISSPVFMGTLAGRLPGRKATVLDTGCCGMAGGFGALSEKYDLSVQVAQRLLGQINHLPPDTQIIASGTSCRHQIRDLTSFHPKHIAELLAEAL